MDHAEVAKRLADHQAELREFPIAALSLFGSVERGDATEQSDVDLLVEFSGPIGLFGFARLQRVLAGILGRKVDLVPVDGVKRQLRDRILGEARRVA